MEIFLGGRKKKRFNADLESMRIKGWLRAHKLSTKAPSSSSDQIVMHHRHGYRLKRLNIAVGTNRMISMIKAQNHGV